MTVIEVCTLIMLVIDAIALGMAIMSRKYPLLKEIKHAADFQVHKIFRVGRFLLQLGTRLCGIIIPHQSARVKRALFLF